MSKPLPEVQISTQLVPLTDERRSSRSGSGELNLSRSGTFFSKAFKTIAKAVENDGPPVILVENADGVIQNPSSVSAAAG